MEYYIGKPWIECWFEAQVVLCPTTPKHEHMVTIALTNKIYCNARPQQLPIGSPQLLLTACRQRSVICPQLLFARPQLSDTRQQRSVTGPQLQDDRPQPLATIPQLPAIRAQLPAAPPQLSIPRSRLTAARQQRPVTRPQLPDSRHLFVAPNELAPGNPPAAVGRSFGAAECRLPVSCGRSPPAAAGNPPAAAGSYGLPAATDGRPSAAVRFPPTVANKRQPIRAANQYYRRVSRWKLWGQIFFFFWTWQSFLSIKNDTIPSNYGFGSAAGNPPVQLFAARPRLPVCNCRQQAPSCRTPPPQLPAVRLKLLPHVRGCLFLQLYRQPARSFILDDLSHVNLKIPVHPKTLSNQGRRFL